MTEGRPLAANEGAASGLAVLSPDAGKRHVRSYSQLHTWHECPELFRLERIVRVPVPQALWFPAGTTVHAVTEEHDRRVFAGDAGLSEGQISRLWRERFTSEVAALREIEPDVTKWRMSKQGKSTEENLAWWNEHGPRLCHEYVKWRQANPRLKLWSLTDGEPAIELKMETHFGGVPFVGYIDRVFRDVDTGALLVVDIKSGSRMPETSLQMGTYGQAIDQEYGVPVWYGAFYDARKACLAGPYPLDRWTADYLGELFADMDAKIAAGQFTPNIGRHCNWCIMRKQGFCKYQGGVEPAPQG